MKYSIEQGELLQFELVAEDPDSSYDGGFGMYIDLKQTGFWGFYEGDFFNPYLRYFTFKPELTTPPANYTIKINLFNITDYGLLSENIITIEVKELEVNAFSLNKDGQVELHADQKAVQDVKFTVKEVTRAGLITIGFSQPLRVPSDEDRNFIFNTLTDPLIKVEFQKNSLNDYNIEYSYEPVEFDKDGYWCTFQLIFNENLYVSLGEYPDTVKLYMLKDYFLWKWRFIE